MIRISTIFVGICMVLIAASLGLVVYGLIGLRVTDAAIVAVTALAFLILFNAVSMRLRDRNDASTQIAALSRGTADLARQITEFGRRLAAAEARMALATPAAATQAAPSTEPLLGELTELGSLVRQLAISVAEHDDILNGIAGPVPALPPDALDEIALANPPEPMAQPVTVEPPIAAIPTPAPPSANAAEVAAAIRRAVETNQLELYLQPVVTLPQRKVKFYEAMSRLRGTSDQLVAASDFVAIAEQAGMMPQLDYLALFRCVQVLRRLTVRNKEVGTFCNISRATLRDVTSFQQCLDFLDANRALAPLFILEFKQSTFRNLGPVESEHLAALAQRGFRFSIDNVTDLRIEARELADRGVRFIKVPAALLLDPGRLATSEIHAADLSDLLGRFGIELIAERIENERTAVDLLDFDIHYGQGFLFSPPRPLRPEAPAAAKNPAPPVAATTPGPGTPRPEMAAAPRTGLSALARRAGSS